MITVPIYTPLAHTLGFNEVWFSMLMLLTLEIGSTTPPFGLQLFVLKSVVPNASMGDVYWSCLPYTVIDMISVLVMIAFPILVLMLPNLMMSN
jgi:TRAP-type C4-dicarboxylate transport system permease large subunit